MKGIRIFIFLLVINLVGCSSLTVHIVAENVPKQTLADIKYDFEKLGYNVNYSKSFVPTTFENVALCFSPMYVRFEDIRDIQSVLSKHQIPSPIHYNFGEENQIYTKGNIGLYLRN